MDEDGLPIVGSGVDLTKVPAIQQRRVVAHLNQFVVHTVRFLNRFSTVCEELSSIPGLEEVTVDGLNQQQSVQSNGPVSASQNQSDGVTARGAPPSQPGQSQPEAAPAPEKAEAVPDNVMTVAKDQRYARYLKMVQVGVPPMAIRNKMLMEGLDPNLLDTPDAPVPDGAASSTENEDIPATSSDSESSFIASSADY
ncbi:hypothetical protein CCH79_00015241 [Gambusia affinis]|uniref:WASH complex subunit 3 n=1 Tax=Gambusia affinis TaxID=33528 RepID=A0A315VRI3_GAMAF|nr:hypothetical protein CCH79_00015241 [Gambusia affinis]